MSTKERYERVRAEVDLACEKAGRNPHEVLLLAVSKTVDLDQVQEAIEGGAHAFGENRPDEPLRKRAAFPQETWHFIGISNRAAFTISFLLPISFIRCARQSISPRSIRQRQSSIRFSPSCSK